MPIKWSAVKVSEAMDEIEHRINLAEAFLAEVKAKAREARNIANLPGYLDDHLRRLILEIERIDYFRSAIKALRSTIPDGAIEAEQEKLKYGSRRSLM
ncbi:MAG: hypothetical protein QMC90_03105 [Dehalococcoidales bacterium]|nr:hypothetical protein [Dehalococcoidales bacterium]